MAAQASVILETEHFVAFHPFASLSPFHTWFFPRHHLSSFDEIQDPELEDFACALKSVLAKLYFGLNNPDYNYSIRSIPTRGVVKWLTTPQVSSMWVATCQRPCRTAALDGQRSFRDRILMSAKQGGMNLALWRRESRRSAITRVMPRCHLPLFPSSRTCSQPA
jgi:hypothetical protein